MARPRFEPTSEHRKIVEMMAACGIPEVEIAKVIGPDGIDPKTLRRHFRRELDVGAIKAKAAVGQTMFRMATSGKHPSASMFWLKCRAQWRETTIIEHTGAHGGPLEVVHLDQKIRDQLTRAAAVKVGITAISDQESAATAPASADLESGIDPTRAGACEAPLDEGGEEAASKRNGPRNNGVIADRGDK